MNQTKPVAKLTDADGNVFNVIGICAKALRHAGMAEAAGQFRARAFAAGSYDEVLQLAMEYCDVQ